VADTRIGGIGLGGILVLLGIVLIIVWSFWWGLIIVLTGLVPLAASLRASGTDAPFFGRPNRPSVVSAGADAGWSEAPLVSPDRCCALAWKKENRRSETVGAPRRD
jgi:hypothetical protein